MTSTANLSNAYRKYVLALLTLVYTMNYLDRYLVALLMQPIKEDLQLSDTQLGFLTGIAFGLFYAVLGLPIARWADRGNRVTITSIAIALWGGTVISCVFVGSFFQLAAARVAAAVGESGCMPPTYSLLGDYFATPKERARAMAIYCAGSPLAALISFVLGGWLNQRYGWRQTFLIMGIPALLIGILVKMTISEPRANTSDPKERRRQLPRMPDVLRILWKQRSSRHLGIAIILLWTLLLGLAPWIAAFLTRSHGMPTAEVGVWLGPITGLSGIAGVLLGGYAASHWLVGNERAQMRLSAVVIGLLVPLYILFLLLPQKRQSLLALVPLTLVSCIFVAPTLALMQRLVVDEMRATMLAVLMLLANLIGMGVGPQAVGILSDMLMPTLGSASLRYAMLIVSFIALWSAYHFWQVGKTVEKDLIAVAHRTMSTLTAASSPANVWKSAPSK